MVHSLKSPAPTGPKRLWQVPSKMHPRPSGRVLETVAFSQLALLGPDDGGFQSLNRLLTLIQAGHGINIEIHTQAVTELIAVLCGHHNGIVPGDIAGSG
jgi:hypothetical protein